MALLNEHGALDSKGRFSLYQSIYAHRQSKEGWQLEYDDLEKRLWVLRYGERVVSWSRSTLARSLEKKHRETAFVSAESRGRGATEEFRFTGVLHARGADIDRYIATLLDGGACHDFAMHRTETGGVRDHGFLFRIDEGDLALVFREISLHQLLASDS